LQANKYVEALEEVAQMLADNPDIGTNRDVLLPGLLSFPYQCHIFYYKRNTHGVNVVRVLHASMDAMKHIKSV